MFIYMINKIKYLMIILIYMILIYINDQYLIGTNPYFTGLSNLIYGYKLIVILE